MDVQPASRRCVFSIASAKVFARYIASNAAVFYERGCQEKHLPADRPPGRKTSRGSQPLLRRDEMLIRLARFSTLHHSVVLSSETEKHDGGLIADHSSM